MKAILISIGSVFILYGLGVNAIVSGKGWFNYVFCIAGALLIVLGLLWKQVVKLPSWLKVIFLIIFALCLVNFAVAEAKIIKTANSTPSDDAKAIIILGAKVNDSGVSLEFARRIDAALDYAKEHPDVYIVTTGGQGLDEPMAEGDAAAERLIARGIDKDRIIVENKSDSTRENFSFAEELMNEKGLKEDDEIIIVSSAFHLYRAGKIAKSCGFENISYLGVRGKAFLLPQYYFREYAALIYESLKGYY